MAIVAASEATRKRSRTQNGRLVEYGTIRPIRTTARATTQVPKSKGPRIRSSVYGSATMTARSEVITSVGYQYGCTRATTRVVPRMPAQMVTTADSSLPARNRARATNSRQPKTNMKPPVTPRPVSPNITATIAESTAKPKATGTSQLMSCLSCDVWKEGVSVRPGLIIAGAPAGSRRTTARSVPTRSPNRGNRASGS